MSRKLSKSRKKILLKKVEIGIEGLENNIDGIIGEKQCLIKQMKGKKK